jgi:hypothetical protein
MISVIFFMLQESIKGASEAKTAFGIVIVSFLLVYHFSSLLFVFFLQRSAKDLCFV